MGIQSEKILDKPKRKHPRALSVLFFTEMWERFSYYGMRALLVLYAIKHLQFSDLDAGKLYGAYTGFVYLTPILGGFLADRYLGFRRSIFIGCILMGLGHLSLAIERLDFFYLGLVLLVVGNGFFKPNMSGLVGRLYENNQQDRDNGYTIFYMGINLGGFLGPIVCGFLGEELGWHYGFGAAGIGMFLGLVVFSLGQKLIPGHLGRPPMADPIRGTEAVISQGLTSEEISKIKVIVVLSFFSIFFWTAFEQAGSSMNLFADRYVDRVFAGIEIPASMFQSVNPIFILLFAPVFARLWTFLSSFRLEPSAPEKFSMGLVLLSMGFFCLVVGSKEVEATGSSSVLWLLLAYLLNTWGELCLSPVGLSMVSGLSPQRLNGLLMGIWLMSNAVSHMIGGWISGYMEIWSADLFFFAFSLMGILAALLLFFIRKKLFSMSEE